MNNTTQLGTLAETLIKVRLSQSFWNAEVQDKQTSREIEHDKQAKANSTRAMVSLIAGSELYAKAKTAKGDLYTYYLSVTSPWEDRGARVMLGAHAMETMEELRVLKKRADDAAEAFCTQDYPEIYERALFSAGGNGLGGLASRVIDKYPSPELVATKFSNTLSIEPMGQIETLRRFGNVFTEQDLAEFNGVVVARMEQAQADAWKKLAAPLEDLLEKCANANENNRWADTILTNVKDIVMVIDRLNITGDPRLNQLALQALGTVDGVTKDDLKHDKALRDVTRAKVEALLDRF